MYFNYEGIDFKLIKGTTQYQDVLCCILNVDSCSGPSYDKEIKRTEEIALKFLSCLSWELKLGIICERRGVSGWSKGCGGLSSVKLRTCSRMPRKLRNRRLKDITRLPEVKDKYQTVAVGLFREAKAATSCYYKFLCYWKILKIFTEMQRRKNMNIQDWINDTISNNKWILKRAHFDKQVLANQTVSQWLDKTCRNAVAHVKTKPHLRPDNIESLNRFYMANNIMEWLVDIFMKDELKLNSNTKDDCLYLIKKKGKSVPVFVQGSRTCKINNERIIIKHL